VTVHPESTGNDVQPVRDASIAPLWTPYAGRRLLVVGGTGFLGSVVLSLLMRELPSLGRLYVLVRRRPGMPAERRFRERILPDAAFDPVRERLGDRFDVLVEEKVRVLEGDLGDADLGLSGETLKELSGSLDVVINASGLVDFHAPLGRAYRTNILGTEHLVDVCRRTGAALVHTSTAFVAGERTGRVPEQVEVGWFPRGDDLPHLSLDPEAEVADIRAEMERISAEVDGPAVRAELVGEASERYREANGIDPTAAQLDTALRRALRDRRTEREVEAGRARAAAWGWPNVYTYSKSLAEQRIAASDIRWSIVRPTIVESALAYPEPGWNRNATTTAPLVMLALAGYRPLPADADHVVDLIPVDQVAWTILAAGAALLEGDAEPVYQAGTSDRQPFTMRRLSDLVGLYLHEEALDGEEAGPRAWWKASQEPRLVDADRFRHRAELIRTLAGRLESVAGRIGDRVRARRACKLVERIAERARRVGREVDQATDLWEIFLPFSHDLSYRFETANTAALAERYGGGEMPVFDPESLDWRHYWLDVHIPGLRRWVLSDEMGAPREVRPRPATLPLTERIAALADTDGNRRAASYPVGPRPYALTYAEAWAGASALRAALAERLGDPGNATVAVATPADAPWWVGMLAVTAGGGTAVLVTGDAEDVPDGCDGLLRLTGRSAATWITTGGAEGLALADVGEADPPEAGGAIAFTSLADGGVADAVPLRMLASRLADLAERLGIEDGMRVVLPLDEGRSAERALALLWLVLLDRGVTVDCTAPEDAADAVRAIQPEAVVATASAWPALASLADGGLPAGIHRLVDLDPGGAHRTGTWAGGGVPVAQAIADPAGTALVATRDLSGAEGSDPPFAAVPPWRIGAERGVVQIRGPGGEDWSPTGLRGEAEGSGVRIRPRLLVPGEPVPVREVFRAAPVGRARVQPAGRRGVRLVAVPDLDEVRTLQDLRRDLLRDVERHNAAAPREERVLAVAITLNGDIPAGDLAWIATRSRADLDNAPPTDERAEWACAVLATAVSPAALDFYVRTLREETVDDLRLEAWERVILDGIRSGDLHAQAFVQAFEAEAARVARADRRLLRGARRVAENARAWTEREDPDSDLLPQPVTDAVKAGVGGAIRAFYRHGMKVTVRGVAHVPMDRNFLVVANHSSHLDGGLVKYALGPWGERVHALAAKDYFFGTPARRFLSDHFTRLIPTERSRVTSEWLRRAQEVMEMGDCVLIFPEGTRTPGPEVADFKASLGTLIRTVGAPVLPVFISGTSEILPKGKAIPRGREATVHVGPPIEMAALQAPSEAGGTLGHDRWIAETVREALLSVPDGDFWWLRRPRERRDDAGDPAAEEVG
jgi:1-acyl-sn-glycerol-3-phosphate acyltransferase